MSLKFQNKLLQESTIVIGKHNNKTIKATQPPPHTHTHTQRTAQTDKQREKDNIL